MSINTKEVQKLLVSLGHSIEVDGIWGPKSQAAMDAALGSTSGSEIPNSSENKSTGTFWDDIKYFKREEFRCHCGKCGGFPKEPEEALVRVADQVREHFNLPVTVSSGVRCAAHNAKVGGVSNSRHLSGKAMDFCVRGMSSSLVKVYVDQLVKQGKLRYCYCIDSGFVHMDIP